MNKVVNLSVHRNTREKKKRREVSDALMRNAKNLAGPKDINGFSLVVWYGDGSTACSWRRGMLPHNVIPEHTKRALERRFNKLDARDEIWGPEDAS